MQIKMGYDCKYEKSRRFEKSSQINQTIHIIKMFKIFKRKDKFNSTLYDLQLKIENQQGQLNELREMILQISRQVNSIQIELDYLINNKYGKSI
jgi:hypothetical protein